MVLVIANVLVMVLIKILVNFNETQLLIYFSIIIKVCIHHTVNNVNNSERKCFSPTECAQNKVLSLIFVVMAVICTAQA